VGQFSYIYWFNAAGKFLNDASMEEIR